MLQKSNRVNDKEFGPMIKIVPIKKCMITILKKREEEHPLELAFSLYQQNDGHDSHPQYANDEVSSCSNIISAFFIPKIRRNFANVFSVVQIDFLCIGADGSTAPPSKNRGPKSVARHCGCCGLRIL